MSETFYVYYPFLDPKTGQERLGREGPYPLQKTIDRRAEIGKTIGMAKPYVVPIEEAAK